jgi:hypothetical protein
VGKRGRGREGKGEGLKQKNVSFKHQVKGINNHLIISTACNVVCLSAYLSVHGQ